MMLVEEKAMRFNEIAQNAEDDEFNKWDVDDTRRPKMTLRHLNKMRKRRESAKAEHDRMTKGYKVQYSAPAPE